MNTAALQSFKNFLVSKNYSTSTIRNYLSDIDAYFDFVKTLPLTPSLDRAGVKKAPLSRGAVEHSETEGFNSEIISAYLKSISSDPNYRRYLSSLSKFFQFTLDQGLTKTNPLKAALKNKKTNINEIINQYSEYLNKKNFSESTVRNYLNDIRQFIDWNNANPNPTLSLPPRLGEAGDRAREEENKNKNLLSPALSRSIDTPERVEGFRKGFDLKSLFKTRRGLSEN